MSIPRKIEIIYEDDNFIALNKPAGILVHGDKKQARNENSEETIVKWLIRNYPEIRKVGDDPQSRPGIVHRLDKDTSGVLIVSKNQKFFDYLKNLFQKHEVRKTYLALVWGEISKKGVINKPIGLKPGTVKRSVRGKDLKMIKEAITKYQPLRVFSYNTSMTIVAKMLYFTLIQLIPKTGRTHQLRVHLASIYHPIVGDSLYGSKKNPWNLKRQFLHAKSVEFTSIDGKRIKLEADLPEELQKILESL